MSTIYDGIPGNVVVQAALNILSSTNANPIQVTVSGSLPADFATGVLVHIAGHASNTSANGQWAATVTGASTFTIPVAGVGVGGASGTVQPLNLTPSFADPSDGDNANAASIFGIVQTLGDRTQYLAARTGQYKLAQKSIAYYSNPLASVGTPWCHIAAGGVTAATPAQMTSDGVAWAQVAGSNFTTLPTTLLVAPVFAMTGITFGDLIQVTLTTTLNLAAAGAGRIALYGSAGTPTIVPSWPGGYAAVAGASAYGPIAVTAVSVTGVSTIGFAGVDTFWIQPVYVPAGSVGSTSPSFCGDTVLVVDVLRPTGVPQ